MAIGIVKFFDAGKGFGFIKPKTARKTFSTLGFIQNAGMDTLAEGQRVSFEVVTERQAGGQQPESCLTAYLSSAYLEEPGLYPGSP